nr:hypothetical protein [Acetatifactor sp.]
IRQAYMFDELDYDNKENYLRFWFCFLMGLIGAVVCAFLPAGGWPYMPIYVLLALFSNMSSGIIGGSVLLMISTLLSEVNLGVSFLYFVSGIFAITLFVHLSGEFKVGVRLMLALLCLLLCETEGTVLLANERFRPELFVIPLANCILSGIILLLIMNLFSSKVIFRFRGVYLDLNDTENEILSKFRAESKQDYMHSVHTAYFCERIARKLNLNDEVLKCAGYYHKVCMSHPELLDNYNFPDDVRAVLNDYQKKNGNILRKETAVLLCSDMVMNAIQYLIDKSNGQTIKYENVIDAVFKKLEDSETFAECNISIKDLYTIKKTFKEEKLYYDFLH